VGFWVNLSGAEMYVLDSFKVCFVSLWERGRIVLESFRAFLQKPQVGAKVLEGLTQF